MLNHTGTRLLETNRLILRQYKITDVYDIFNNWAADLEVARFWQWEPHKNTEETKNLLTDWIKNYSVNNYYHWAIELKNTSQAIGYIYFADINDIDNSLSVHYALGRKYWNQGIMTEACKYVFKFAFTVLKAEKIHSSHHINNPGSGKVQQKNGMRRVKTEYKKVPECERISGDYCYYEITLAEWNNKITDRYSEPTVPPAKTSNKVGSPNGKPM